jgi:hypothetical protein
VNDAEPLTRSFVPSTVLPSLNVTSPVGAPAVRGYPVTVAEKVKGCPKTAGFWEELNATTEPPSTDCARGADEADAKEELPTYCAAMA